MALARVDFFSDALGLSTSMSVILPQEAKTQIGLSATRLEGDVPVLPGTHGDDDTTWSPSRP